MHFDDVDAVVGETAGDLRDDPSAIDAHDLQGVTACVFLGGVRDRLSLKGTEEDRQAFLPLEPLARAAETRLGARGARQESLVSNSKTCGFNLVQYFFFVVLKIPRFFIDRQRISVSF